MGIWDSLNCLFYNCMRNRKLIQAQELSWICKDSLEAIKKKVCITNPNNFIRISDTDFIEIKM